MYDSLINDYEEKIDKTADNFNKTISYLTAELDKIKFTELSKRKNSIYLKYYYYRFIKNFTFGKLKLKIKEKETKYKDLKNKVPTPKFVIRARNIFSVRNEYSGAKKHKVVNILELKIKLNIPYGA